jgi:hypothetical protein
MGPVFTVLAPAVQSFRSNQFDSASGSYGGGWGGGWGGWGGSWS